MSVLVHKAVEPANLSVEGKKLYQELLTSVIEGTPRAWVQPKFDGVHAVFLYNRVENEWQAYSRTGQLLRSVSPSVLEVFEGYAWPQRAYIGELWVPGVAHSEINGRARKRTPQTLEVRLFDTYHASCARCVPYEDRHEFLFSHGPVKVVPTIRGLRGEVASEEDLYRVALEHTGGASAYDGLILRDGYGLFTPGAGKGGEVIKIKPRKTGDFRVVGTSPGLGNRAGGVGALVLDLGGGVQCEVGTGLTKAEVFSDHSPVGLIAEVGYLGVTKDGKLREPSFKGYRFDKDTADVLEYTQQTED